jgi:hypothetical protein
VPPFASKQSTTALGAGGGIHKDTDLSVGNKRKVERGVHKGELLVWGGGYADSFFVGITTIVQFFQHTTLRNHYEQTHFIGRRRSHIA